MADTFPPMIERGLRRSFAAVPSEIKVIYDWHSEPGERFLTHVDAAVRAGYSVDRIGQMLGIRNFGARYAAARRSR